MNNQWIFRTSSGISIHSLRDLLSNDYSITSADESQCREELYDTFDMRLYKNNRVLIYRNGRLSLYGRNTGIEENGLEWEGKDIPLFPENFPAGELKDAIAPVIDVRSLIRVITVEEATHRLEVRNKDRKTVAVCTLLHRTAFSTEEERVQLDPIVVLTPLKGFRDNGAHIARILRSRYTEIPMNRIFDHLFEIADQKKLIREVTYPPRLDPTWSTCHALKVLLSDQLETAEREIDGMSRDIDTEFLHDFRVALRRSRAALSGCRSVLSKEKHRKLTEALKTLASRTGPLRDYDVMLLDTNKYISLVPKRLHQGLENFFGYIGGLRDSAFTDMTAFLDTEEFSAAVGVIKDFCSSGAGKWCTEENTSISSTASGVIISRFALLRKRIDRYFRGKADIHQVRIDCKKLRYFMEMFSQFYPRKRVAPVIKDLKTFQTSLGNLHDVIVQQEILMESLDKMQHSGYASPEANAAVGGIVTSLTVRQQEMEKSIEDVLMKYRKKIKGKEMTKLFSIPG